MLIGAHKSGYGLRIRSLTPGCFPLVRRRYLLSVTLLCRVNRLGFGPQVRRSITCALLGSHRKCVFEETGFVRDLLAIPSLIVNAKGRHSSRTSWCNPAR